MSAPTRSEPGRTSRPSAPAPSPASPNGAQALTFVFTDIEGSTRLLEQLRERYAEVLATHGRLIGAATSRAGGELVDTQGDAFFLAFRSADQAVAFATDAQHALARQRWPARSSLRVRMGIHTGEATRTSGGYVGLDVHRAARISSVAHGGQVLLSAEAARQLANGTALKALGSHGLKDFAAPIALHQLLVDGLPADFPPPRSVAEPDQPPAEGEPPYQGLAHFEEQDAARFFGREKLVGRLVARLARQRFLAVIGASGSGKSSVVRAGLLPALREKGVARVVLLTPTAEPFAALAAALLPDSGEQERAELAELLRASPTALADHLGADSLLVLDQAEELFSLCRDEATRAAFIERLLSARASGGYVVVTLRADFYDRLAGYPALRDAVAAQQEYLGQLSAEELRAAIEGPAKAGDWRFDAGLVDLILHDVGSEPGALPLLSHALLETWQRRRGRLMMLRGYLESGGVQGAIARSADRLMAELEPAQQLIAKAIFLRLTEFGAGTPDTRRRAALTELLGQAEGEPAAAVLQRLADRRLVVLGSDTAEVAHEALIREWPTLREWLAADREALRLHRGLTDAAGEWQRSGREPSLLFRGARLAAVLDWAPAHETELNALEREFVEESRLASERDAQRQRQINRRLRFLLAGAGVFLVLALAAGAYAALEAGRAEQEALRAEEQAQLATARALAASAINVLEEDPQLGMHLALRAVEAGGDLVPEAVTALHRATQASRSLLHLPVPLPADAVRPDDLGLALSPDGRRLYVATDSRSVRVYNAETGELIDTLGTPGTDSTRHSLEVALWQGRLLAYVDEDAVIHVWDLEQGTEQKMKAPGAGTLRRPAFSSDGRLIAVQTYASPTRDREYVLTVWDLPSGGKVAEWSGDDIPDLAEVSFHPDGRLLVPNCDCTADGKVRWFNIESGAINTIIEGEAMSNAALSPDGQLIATVGHPDDNIVKLWGAETGNLIRTFRGHGDLTQSVAFSSDARLLASTAGDGTTRVWDVESGGDPSGVELALLAGQGGIQRRPHFSADGTMLATTSNNGTVRLWDVAPTRVGEHSAYDFGFARILSIERAGHRAIILGRPCGGGFCHGDAVVLDLRTAAIDRHPYNAGLGAGISHNGTQLFTQVGEPGEDSTRHLGPIRAVALETGAAEYDFQGICAYSLKPDGGVQCGTAPVTPYDEQAGRFSSTADGSMIAMSGNNSGALALWSADGQMLLSLPSHWLHPEARMDSFGVALSPDGSLVAVATYEHGVMVLETATLLENRHLLMQLENELRQLESELRELDVELREFERAGQHDTVADRRQAITDRRQAITDRRQAITGGIEALLGNVRTYDVRDVWRLKFTPDATQLAVAGPTNTRVFDVASTEQLHELLPSWDLDLNSDGTRMVTMGTDGYVHLWDVTSGRELQSIPSVNYGLGNLEGAVRFAEDERYVLTADAGMLVIHTVDVDELIRIASDRLTRQLTDLECQRYLQLDTCPSDPVT